jgi:hypothetical protein
MADPIKKDAIDKQTKKNNPTRVMMGSREFISFFYRLQGDVSTDFVSFFFCFIVKLSKRLANVVWGVAIDKLAVAVANDDHRGFLSVGGGVAHAQRIQQWATCCKLFLVFSQKKNLSAFSALCLTKRVKLFLCHDVSD